MAAAASKTAILVLGMHRSGTSTLTRLVNLLGADVGEDLLPLQADNPSGHWEHAGVVDLHRRALKLLGLQGWDDPAPLPAGWVDDERIAPLQDELAELLSESLDAEEPWVVKDPRLCRLLPMWWPVLKRLGRKPICVHVERAPVEVAASLAARDGMSAERAHQLWLRHVLEAERSTRGRRRGFFRYEAILDDTDAALAQLATLTGLAPRGVDAALREGAAAFVDPKLRRQKLSALGDAAPTPELEAIAAALMALAETDDRATRAALSELGERELAKLESALPAQQAPEPAEPEAAETAGRTGAVYTAVERWDHGQLDARGISGELLDGQQLSFEVAPRHPNFCALELLVGTYGRRNTSVVEIEVCALAGDSELEELVARDLVEAHRLADNAWHTVRFVPQVDSQGRRYRVHVRSPGAEVGDAVTLYTSEAGELAFRAYYAALVEAADREVSGESAAPAVASLNARVADLASRLGAAQRHAEEALSAARDALAEAQRVSAAVGPEVAKLAQEQAERESGEQAVLKGRLSSLDAASRAREEGLRAELAQHSEDVSSRLGELAARLQAELAEGLEQQRAAGQLVADELTRQVEQAERLSTGFGTLAGRVESEISQLRQSLARTETEGAGRASQHEAALAALSERLDAQERETVEQDERRRELEVRLGEELHREREARGAFAAEQLARVEQRAAQAAARDEARDAEIAALRAQAETAQTSAQALNAALSAESVERQQLQEQQSVALADFTARIGAIMTQLEQQDQAQSGALRVARGHLDRLASRCDELGVSLRGSEVRTREAFEILRDALMSEEAS